MKVGHPAVEVWCASCNKPADSVAFDYNFAHRLWEITAWCHGKMDTNWDVSESLCELADQIATPRITLFKPKLVIHINRDADEDNRGADVWPMITK